MLRTVPKSQQMGFSKQLQQVFQRMAYTWHQPEERVTQKGQLTLSFCLSSLFYAAAFKLCFLSYFLVDQTHSAEPVFFPPLIKLHYSLYLSWSILYWCKKESRSHLQKENSAPQFPLMLLGIVCFRGLSTFCEIWIKHWMLHTRVLKISEVW